MAGQPALKIGTLRVVCFALIGGLAAITAVAAYFRTHGVIPTTPGAVQIMPPVVAVVFASSVVVHTLMRSRFISEAAKSKAETLQLLSQDSVPQMLGTATFVSAALFEGPGLLGAITLMIGGPWYCLAAPILAIAAIMWIAPSRESFEEMVRASGP